MQAHMRASDADRDRVVSELGRHAGAGRLTLDEFDARTQAAYRSRTIGELAALTDDLPGPAPAQLPQPPAPRPSLARTIPVEWRRRRNSSCWPCW